MQAICAASGVSLEGSQCAVLCQKVLLKIQMPASREVNALRDVLMRQA